MSKISVTRALAELKAIKGRIDTAIQEGVFVAVTKGLGPKRTVYNTAVAVQTVEEAINSHVQKVAALVIRQNALKRAVIASNASTGVTIGDINMTVAEAIERKNSVAFQENFVLTLRRQQLRANDLVQKGNAALDEQIDKAVTAAYGSEAKSKPSDESYQAIAGPRRADHQLALLDPVGIQAMIDKLSEEIISFKTEVDFVLSESNAKTEVEV